LKQYVLQNILKIKPIYSAAYLKCEAACSSEYPKDAAVCSSEYPEDKASIFCRMS